MLVFRGSGPALLIAFAVLASACKAYDRGALDPEQLPHPDAGDGAVIVPGDGGPSPNQAGRDPGGQAGRGGGRDAGPVPAPSCEESAGGSECNEDCVERCNGVDDDCDGVSDEDEAAASCAVDHTSALCREGACLIVQCRDDYRDCDRDADTGCETAPDDPNHCGRCGLVCDLPNAIATCDEGRCVAIGCAEGAGDCDADGQSCETPLDSLDDCGDCGEPCGGLANASPQCDSGSCGIKECLGNFGDCDGDADNGCETALDSLQNCGGCEEPCGKASCSGGVCSAVLCTDPTADCDADEVDCEIDLSTDKDNCGGCGRACAFRTQTPRATLACANKVCDAVCEGGFGDCDEDYATGCETSLGATPQHCGACGRSCNALLPHTTATGCSSGSCTVTTCASGWGDCDGVASNGCERNTTVEGPCFPDTNCVKRTFGTHDYFFCTNASSWTAARDKCRVQARGNLVNIGSAAENAFVAMNRASDAWIGARDAAIEGLWRWENNGVPFWRGTGGGTVQLAQYENWGNNQPDEFNNAEDCAEIHSDGSWNDQSCTVTRGFVCEQMPDECPSSSSKVDPGQCGCATADADADSDGFADCNETCDTDPNKQAPGVCGCGMSDADDDDDGTPNCRDDCPGDPTQTAECLTFVPTNFNPDPINFSAQPSSTLNCGTTTVNTNDPDGTGPMVATISNWCGGAPVAIAQAQTGGPEAVVIGLRGLTVASGNTLRLIGSRPVIFAVDGNVTIAGTIDADASGSTPGAGGNFNCGTSQGRDGSGSSSAGACGGGGGAFGTAGGRGGDGGGGSRGNGGVARGSSNLSPLFGGCAGGRGGGCSAGNNAGGGAVQISASGTLTVSGTIRANGGAGTNGCGSEGGGNGGGAGGAIFLEAITLSAGGTLQVNGGRGGNGAGGPSGPNGSTSSSNPGGDGGSSGTNGGAGGGGGYGRIRTLTR